MFGWLFSREVDNFAIDLARDFSKRCPPRPDRQPVAGVVAGAIDDACNRALEFKRARRLGVYGKAKLGTAFKYELKELGYPEEFVNELTRQLLLKLSAK